MRTSRIFENFCGITPRTRSCKTLNVNIDAISVTVPFADVLSTFLRTALAATRMLTQTLCNLVTGNEGLLNQLWEPYLKLPEEQLILL